MLSHLEDRCQPNSRVRTFSLIYLFKNPQKREGSGLCTSGFDTGQYSIFRKPEMHGYCSKMKACWAGRGKDNCNVSEA